MDQDKEWIKKEIAKILVKEGLMNEAFGQGGRHSDLWNTFVTPFTDVVKAVKYSGQDILSAVKLNLDVLLALDPDTIKAAHDKYDERKKKMDAKWKPLMDANKAAGGGDAELLAFALNPGFFLGTRLAKKASKAPKDVYNYLDDAGISLPLRSLVPGANPEPPKDDGGGLLDTAKNVVGKLADIFFIAHHAPAGPMLSEDLISEAEDEKKEEKGLTPAEIEKELANYFEESGLDKVFEETADDLLDMREEMLDDLLTKVKPQLDLLLALMEASNPEEFAQALEGAKEANLAQAIPPNFMQDIDKQAEELAADPKFKEELQKKKKDITDEEVLETAKKTTFSQSKEELQIQLEEGGEEIVKQALEAIEYDMPDEETQKAIEKTPVGKQYFEVVEKAKKELMGYIQ